MKCQKVIKSGCMPEARPCIRDHYKNGLGGTCTPDLTGMQFGNYTVTKRADDAIIAGIHHTQWYVRDKLDRIVIQPSESLIKGVAKGLRSKKNMGMGAWFNGKKRPEYQTVLHHYHDIFNSEPGTKNYRSYHGVPFYDGWNRKKGGSVLAGMNWIIDNLGPKPKGAHLHMVPLNKGGKGFGPWKADDGGWSIRWLTPQENNAVENKRFVEHMNNEEFEKEAARRGFKLIRIAA